MNNNDITAEMFDILLFSEQFVPALSTDYTGNLFHCNDKKII